MKRLTLLKVRPGRFLLFALVMAALLLLGAQHAHEAMAQMPIRTINLNTGYDQATSRVMGVGEKDNEWRVMTDPGTYTSPYYSTLQNPPPPNIPPPLGYATGRPAEVVKATLWSNASANYTSSNWISINPDRYPGTQTPPTLYEYAYYFTLPPGFTSPQLTMKLSADDNIANVTLNSLCAGGALFTGSGGGVNTSPYYMTISATPAQLSCLTSGPLVNELKVTVRDTGDFVTGLIVEGSVTYECPCNRPAVRDIKDLQSITFWESTFAAPTQHTFAASGLELTTRKTTIGTVTGPGPNDNDFVGDPGAPGAEAYDVFYSNWDGTPNANGQFVTIEAVVPGHSPPCCLPSGGGLNIARVDLNFTVASARPTQYADFVSSFVALGDNSMPGIVGYAVDSSTATDTTMGNTSAPPPSPQRLRVTVGFPCQCAQPPAGMAAWWPLDEKAGTLVRDVWDGHNGTAKPVAVGLPTGPVPGAGVVRGALDFPAYSGASFDTRFVDVPTATELEPGSGEFGAGSGYFSIDAWVYPVAPLPNVPAVMPIVDKWDPNFPPLVGSYAFYIQNQHLMFQYTDRIVTSTVVGSATLLYGQWSHVAVTLARTVSYVNPPTFGFSGQLYKDGQPDGPPVPATFYFPITNNVNLRIGGTRLFTDHAEIALDEVEIFDVTVPPEDILAIYNAGHTGKCRNTEASVGGVAALTVSSAGSPVPWTPLAAVAASVMAVMGAGLWYGRRRWLR